MLLCKLKRYEFLVFLIYLKYRNGLFGSPSFQVPHMHNLVPTSSAVKGEKPSSQRETKGEWIHNQTHKTYDRKMLPSTGIARAVTALTWPLNTWIQLLHMQAGKNKQNDMMINGNYGLFPFVPTC